MKTMIALAVAGLLATGTMFAGEHGDCTKQAGNNGMAACQVSLADLNLTPEQQKKMDAVKAEHEKEGCSKATEEKYARQAKAILTPEQYAKFKAECKEGSKDKVQS